MNRRSFLRNASLAGAAQLAGSHFLSAGRAFGQEPSGYKALVCIFLFGGNDSNNVLIPFDRAGYANYAAIRGPLALPQSELLQIGPDYALHPQLPNIQSLYHEGVAGMLANVGTLSQPLTRPQYLAGAGAAPAGLFDSMAQQVEWQTSLENDLEKIGWGGRIADLLNSVFNPQGVIPLCTSVSGDAIFCRGSSTSPLVLDPSDLPSGSLVNKYRPKTPLQTPFPSNNGLAAQLKLIAEIIQVREALGMERQIFFAALHGFTGGAGQLATQAELLALLDPAMAAFYQATMELGIENQVTSFTMSEFNRNFQPNSNGGTYHAWGGHHVIVGGAVRGGQIYGKFPKQVLGGPDDCGSRGQWIPTTALAQYGSTLASWFGVPALDRPVIFPNIGNFSSSNLGFMS